MGKHRISIIVATLTSLGLLCTSCMTGIATDMSTLLQPLPEETEAVEVVETLPEEQDQYSELSDDYEPLELMGPKLRAALLELGYVFPEEDGEALDAVPVPEAEPVVEEEIMEDAEPEVVEPVASSLEETKAEPEPQARVLGFSALMEGDVPDFFTIVFCVLFLSTLFTLCYIPKQRKEARWHMFRE